MKRILAIILAAAALAASPAVGQTIKSLGYNTTNGQVIYSGTNPLTFTNALSFGTNAAATASNLGLGATDDVVFLTLNAILSAGDGNTVVLNSAISFDDIRSENIVETTRTNLGLGSGDNVTFGTLQTEQFLIQIGTNVFANLAEDQTDFLVPVVLGSTLGVTGNATLNGVANLAPAQTADSASSLMTRGLTGQEFANPRNKFQTTYWFGLEGLGQWGAVGQNATTSYLSAGDSGGVGGGQLIYSTAGIGVSAAGAGLRLGSADPYGGSGIFSIAGAGDTTFKTRLQKNTMNIGGPAMASVMGTRTATTMWQNNAPGIYYVPQPTNAWTADAVVAQHGRIDVDGVVFAVSTAGTNGSTAPVFSDLIGSLVTNGSAVYRNVGPHTSNNWVLAIGSTNASQVVMTNTGKVGPVSTSRASYVLTFRVNGTTNVFAKVETGTANGNTAGESAEVSLGAPATTSQFQPQVWSRDDVAGGQSVDPAVRYISVDGPLGNLQ